MNAHIRLYRCTDGPRIAVGARCFSVDEDWDLLFNHPALHARLIELATSRATPEVGFPALGELLAPVEGQEVWAAGVTYLRSKSARVEESGRAGGSNFYDRVYEADRPELFFKATAHRVAGSDQEVVIRRDSNWTVPEPELALAINAAGDIFGYTIGNDMSARDIEAANPLYLTQAKVYDRCCGLGPAILVTPDLLPASTEIRMVVDRNGHVVFDNATSLAEMKRTPAELAHFLLRDNGFPAGCFLLTGTGIVPPDEFALEPGDHIHITIDPIGTLTNVVAARVDPGPAA